MAADKVEKWVCDSCMRIVTRPEIADLADGEHVLCVYCVEEEKARES